MRYDLFLLFLFLILYQGSKAQDSNPGTMKGKVNNEHQEGVGSATVIIQPGNLRFHTDSSGNFFISGLHQGQVYQLKITALGYADLQKEFRYPTSKDTLFFKLLAQPSIIEQVDIVGQSALSQKKEQTIRATLIDVKSVKSRPATLLELMNRTSGVKVRQDGGLGSPANLMINGFQGSAIRVYKDGIPIEYLGGSLNLGTIPVDLLERVEIYKGVMPTELGADALGAAVNLVSKEEDASRIAASYELSSFHTHVFNFNMLRKEPGKPFFYGINGFVNYSKNDYRTSLMLIDDETSVIKPTRLPLFHNGFRQYYAEVYAGIKDQSWADELRIGISSSASEQEVQSDAKFSTPYGAIVSRQKAPFIPTLSYSKRLLDNRLGIQQFLTYSLQVQQNVDTMYVIYDWYGNNKPKEPEGFLGGEAGNGTFSTIHQQVLSSRSYLSYRLNDIHKLAVNSILSDYRRQGWDPWAGRAFGNGDDYLRVPAFYTKWSTVLGLASKFAGRGISNDIQLKYFVANAQGQEYEVFSGEPGSKMLQVKPRMIGFSEAIKWRLGRSSTFRLALERGIRIPEQTEIFGYGTWIYRPNFGLRPEQSWNGYVGWRLEKPNYYVDAQFFYRNSKDLILLRQVGVLFFQHQNIEQVSGSGAEISMGLTLINNWEVSGNLTYQDYRRQQVSRADEESLRGSRLENMPYFFGNLNLQGSYADLLAKNDRFKLYTYWSYTHQFFLYAVPRAVEPAGFLGLWGKTKAPINSVIPSQHNVHVGFWYQFSDPKYQVAMEVKNLFDRPLYDYYKIPKPGRSVHVKFSLTI